MQGTLFLLKFQVIVNPYIKEVTYSNCDCGLYTLQLKEENPDMDFSFLDQFEDPRIWFLEVIADDTPGSMKSQMIAAWKKDPKVESILGVMEPVFPARGEPEFAINIRVNGEKEKLRNYVKENNIGDLEMCIVLKRWTAEYFDANGDPMNSIWLNNAQIIEFELN
jgi:hypothetical protein